jgi:hypothetical protein
MLSLLGVAARRWLEAASHPDFTHDWSASIATDGIYRTGDQPDQNAATI